MGGTSIIKDNRMECKTKFSIDVEFSFSFKGGIISAQEIVDRCVSRIVDDFEK